MLDEVFCECFCCDLGCLDLGLLVLLYALTFWFNFSLGVVGCLCGLLLFVYCLCFCLFVALFGILVGCCWLLLCDLVCY